MKTKKQRKGEVPPPDEPAEKKKGKTARTTARNLLERLRNFEEETLRFMDDKSYNSQTTRLKTI